MLLLVPISILIPLCRAAPTMHFCNRADTWASGRAKPGYKR